MPKKNEKISLHKTIEFFYSGIGAFTAVQNYCTIITLAILHHQIATINGILTAATLGLILIPASVMIPAMFIITCASQLLLMSMPTTIIIFLPIGVGIAQSLQINPAIISATIVTGALCGYHLTHFLKKLSSKYTVSLFCSAIVITCLLLSLYSCTPLHRSMIQLLATNISWNSSLTLIPYFCLFITAAYRINIIANIILTSCAAIIIKIFCLSMPILPTLQYLVSSFYHDSIISELLVIQMMLAGCIGILQYHGGFDYLDNFVHINKKTVDVMHVITSTVTILFPFGVPMILAMHFSKCAYFDLLQYMIYPVIIFFLMLISLLFSSKSST